MIHLENLSVGYKEKQHVKRVAGPINADIQDGELTCLLGTNGVGKSTLLRTLAGFQPPLEGSIYIQGKELKSYNHKQLAQTLSIVLTERCDVPNMSVSDLIGLGRNPYTGFWGTPNETDRNLVRQALTLVGIEALAQREMQTLSDGERQKVMIAKALAQETPVILLDEPTAFLDFPSKVEIMQLLHKLSREMNKTIFLSTHDLELALQIADTLWLMSRENQLCTGLPEDLILNGNLSQAFKHKGISFDENAGLFRVSFTAPNQLYLAGDETSPRYVMLRRALLRNGFTTVHNKQATTHIEVSADEYRIYQHETCLGCTSNIKQVLTLLQRIEADAAHC